MELAPSLTRLLSAVEKVITQDVRILTDVSVDTLSDEYMRLSGLIGDLAKARTALLKDILGLDEIETPHERGG